MTDTGGSMTKRMADWRWGERLWDDFQNNKKMFLKEVQRMRKSEQASDEMVMDVNGEILHEGVEMRRRWDSQLIICCTVTRHLQ